VTDPESGGKRDFMQQEQRAGHPQTQRKHGMSKSELDALLFNRTTGAPGPHGAVGKFPHARRPGSGLCSSSGLHHPIPFVLGLVFSK